MTRFMAQLDRRLTPPADPGGPLAIDLFSGAGGLTLGLKAAGVRTIAAVEAEPYRVQTFRQHTPKAVLHQGDIRRVDFTPR